MDGIEAGIIVLLICIFCDLILIDVAEFLHFLLLLSMLYDDDQL